MRLSRAIASITLLTAVLALPAHAAGIVISPVQIGLVGAPGSTVSGIINVSSPRVEENRIRVTFGDYTIDAMGNREEVPAGTSGGERTCSHWLDVDQEQFVSPERGSVPVVVTAHIPQNASGSYWAAAYFEVVPKPPALNPERPDRPAVGVNLLPRIGVPVIVTVKGTERYSVKVSKISAKRIDRGLEATIVLRNDGNSAVLISGAVALERTGTSVPEELASKDVELVTSYPGADRVIKLTFPATAVAEPSDVNLNAYLRYGPGAEQTIEASSKLASILESEAAAHAISPK